MEKINIFGGDGQHGSDLIKRGVFANFDSSIITEENCEFEELASGIIVPISKTQKLIEKIQSETIDVINFAGIMSTNGDISINDISNFHFLFGPNPTKGLKAVFAGKESETVLQIIDNSRKKGISIIETTVEQHDKNVSIVQALNQLIILLSSLSCNTNKSLINEWNTPVRTIVDMIFENKFFKEILEDFTQNISEGTNISELFLDTVWCKLSTKDLEIFGTPSFFKSLDFCKDNSIIANYEIIELLNNINDRQLIFNTISSQKSSI